MILTDFVSRRFWRISSTVALSAMCKDIFQRLQRDLPPWLGFAIISCVMQNSQNGCSFKPWGIVKKTQKLNLHTKASFNDIHNTAHKNSSGECKSGLVNLKNKPGQWKQATIKDQRIHKLTETIIITTTDVQQPRSWENAFGSRILFLGASSWNGYLQQGLYC